MKCFKYVLAAAGWFFIVTSFSPSQAPTAQVLHIENSPSFTGPQAKQQCQTTLALIQANNPNYQTECAQNGVTLNPACPFIAYGCFQGQP